jgi:hypothetical protein
VLRQCRVEAVGDRRHVGPHGGHHLGQALHACESLVEASDLGDEGRVGVELGVMGRCVWHEGLLLVSGGPAGQSARPPLV